MIILSLDRIRKYGVPLFDYHIHSRYTDGQNTIEEIIKKAIEMGLSEIAITDHVWKSSKWIKDYVKDIEKIRSRFKDKITAYIGLEAKAINSHGELDITVKQREMIELLMGVVHRYPSEVDYDFISIDSLDHQKAAIIEAEITINIIKNARPDILGHPARTYYKFVFPRTHIDFPEDLFYEIVKAAKRYNVLLEFNGRWSTDWMAEILLTENAEFVLGSDAHSINDIGKTGWERIYKIALMFL